MTLPSFLLRHRTTALVGLAILIAAGATLVERQRSPARVGISRAFPFERADSARFRAFVILTAADCSSNLSFMQLFQRDTTRVRLSRLYLLGPRRGLDSTAALLRDQGIETPLLPATNAVERALHQLGSISTPFLIVLDTDGVVRLAMTSPPDIGTYVRLPKLLDELWAQGVYDPLVIR